MGLAPNPRLGTLEAFWKSFETSLWKSDRSFDRGREDFHASRGEQDRCKLTKLGSRHDSSFITMFSVRSEQKAST